MERAVRIGLITAFVMFVSSAAFGDQIGIPFPRVTATVTQTDSGKLRLSIPKWNSSASAGGVGVPAKREYVLIPANADPHTVRVSVLVRSAEVVPAHAGAHPVDTKAYLPANDANAEPVARMAEYQLVPVTLVPYRYDPKTNTAVHVVKGDVVISFATVGKSNAEVRAASPWEKATADLVASRGSEDLGVVNVKDAARWYGARRARKVPRRLTILTSNAVKDGSTKLQAYVREKQRHGWVVNVRTETQVGNSGLVGQAAGAKVRAFLRSIYSSEYREYVLIIENPDPASTGAFPFEACDGWGGPSDYFYADLSGDWDLDGNHKIGEASDYGVGGIDMIAEMSVGRIEYYGNITDVDTALQTDIDWDNGASDGPWLQKAEYVTEGLDGATPAWQPCEALRQDVLTPNQISLYKIFNQPYGVQPYVDGLEDINLYNQPHPNVRSVWAVGQEYVFWMAHGFGSGCAVFDERDLPFLDKTKPSIVFMASCDCARVPPHNNLAFTLTRGGYAVGVVGVTGGGAYENGGTDGREPSINMQGWLYAYSKSVIDDRRPLGDALAYARATRDNPASCWENVLNFNLIGDPTVAARWPSPRAFGITTAAIHPAEIARDGYRFEMKAFGGTQPYAWSLTCGSLPPGLSLGASGVVSGTPLLRGEFAFALEARDAKGHRATRQFSMSVLSSPFVSTTILASGKVGAAYAATLEAINGTAPYTWFIETSGSQTGLPPGIRMDRTGSLTGTPTEAGRYTFTARAVDANNFERTRELSITIKP